jgi:uroporphyrinogen-III decarboxylase
MATSLSVRERLLRAMRGQDLDRIPNAPRIWAWLIQHYGGQGLDEHIRLAEEMPYDPLVTVHSALPNYVYSAEGDHSRLADVSVNVVKEAHSDYEIVTREISTPAGKLRDQYRLGKTAAYGIAPNPHRMEHLVKERGDLAKLRYIMPDPANPAYYQRARSEQERVGDRALVESRPCIGAEHYFVDAIGIDNCMILHYEDRPFFDEALRMCHAYNQTALRSACRAGADVIIDSWYNFSLSAGWSPAIYREAFLPLIAENVAITHEHGLLYHLYDDGKCSALLSDWAGIGVDCISTLPPPPIGDVDLAGAKKEIGDRVCLKGNVDLYQVIRLMQPDAIREVVRNTLAAASKGGRFILSTSDSIREGTPVENVRAYMAAGREFGSAYL